MDKPKLSRIAGSQTGVYTTLGSEPRWRSDTVLVRCNKCGKTWHRSYRTLSRLDLSDCVCDILHEQWVKSCREIRDNSTKRKAPQTAAIKPGMNYIGIRENTGITDAIHIVSRSRIGFVRAQIGTRVIDVQIRSMGRGKECLCINGYNAIFVNKNGEQEAAGV